MRYQLVYIRLEAASGRSNSLYELENKVEIQIKLGYEPLGSPVVIKNYRPTQLNLLGDYLVQAMFQPIKISTLPVQVDGPNLGW